MTAWRFLLESRPHRGSWNMAVDEYLMSSLSGDGATCLRFYRWERPTASIGVSQNLESVVNPDYCRRNGIDIVRRMTGGKLVLHHREITYALASNDAGLFTATLGGSYRLISQALVRGLDRMGVSAGLASESPPSYARGTMPCFSHPARDEVVARGRKIAGSAQRRVGRTFLQHGSIPLEEDAALLKAVSRHALEDDLHLTSLRREIGSPVDFAWAAEHLAAGFAEFFGVTLRPQGLSAAERREIKKIERRTYADARWTRFGPGENAERPETP